MVQTEVSCELKVTVPVPDPPAALTEMPLVAPMLTVDLVVLAVKADWVPLAIDMFTVLVA